MGWAAIITAIMQLFGPMLVEWLQKWLESRLQKASERLPAAESYPEGQAVAQRELFDAAIADLPRLAFARRALLRRLRDASVSGAYSFDEIVDLVALVEDE